MSAATPATTAHVFGQMGPGKMFHLKPADLSRALDLARMNRVDRRVVSVVFELSWHRANLKGQEPLPCHLNISALARKADVSRQYVSLRVKLLVGDGILAVTTDGYLINCDLAAWVASGRLVESDLADVLQGHAPEPRIATLEGCTPAAPRLHPRSAQVAPPATPELRLHPSDRSAQVAPPATPELRSAPAPYRYPSEDPQKTKQTSSKPERAGAGESSDLIDQDTEPFIPPVQADPGSTTPPPLAPAPAGSTPGPTIDRDGRPVVRNDAAEVERTAVFADKVWPEEGVGSKVRMFGGSARPGGPATFWAVDLACAVLEAALKHQDDELANPWAYVNSILRRWAGESDGWPMNELADRDRLAAKYRPARKKPANDGYFDPRTHLEK